MNCDVCDKKFSTKSSLVYHQNNAKYCLLKQGKTNEGYKCSHCEKCFTTRQRVEDHQQKSCKLKNQLENSRLKEELDILKKEEKIKIIDKEQFYEKEIKLKDNYITLIENALQEKTNYIIKLESKLDKLEKQFEIKIDKEDIPISLGEKMNILEEEIKEKDIKSKNIRIKQLEKICLSKQKRKAYPERDVIYIITTEDHIKRRTYIIGKAKNLTNRLSTYNKTCDHSVIHYQECKNEDAMDIAEMMVLNKLRDYREQANRDRFILPEDKDISFFIETVNNCISFIG